MHSGKCRKSLTEAEVHTAGKFLGSSKNSKLKSFIALYHNMAPGKLITRVIQSSNEPAAESEVINRGSCVWSLHRKDEWSATAAVTSLNITH